MFCERRLGRLLLLFACGMPSFLLSQESGLHRLVVGMDNQEGQSISALSPDAGSTKWRLGKSNKTQQIQSAYRYDNWIVVFGWNGCCNGITTILDAATGLEQLEFLTLGSYITDQGVIVFHHWQVHFTEPALISDSINVLDLNSAFPHDVPVDENHNPLRTVGLRIYPSSNESAEKHHIFSELVLAKSDAEDSVFLVDQPAVAPEVCFISLSLKDLSNVAKRRYCVPIGTLTNGSNQSFQMRKFNRNSLGELIFEADIGSAVAYFVVDRATLKPDRLLNPNPTQEALPIPWVTQRGASIRFLQPELKASDLAIYGHTVVTGRLTIDTAGNVRDAVIVGLPKNLDLLVKSAVLSWKFKPTLLNGKQVNISTEFQAQLNTLNGLPD